MSARLSRNSLETGSRKRQYQCQVCGERYERYLSRPEPRGAHYCDRCLEEPMNMLKRSEAYWLAENGVRVLAEVAPSFDLRGEVGND